MQRMTARVVLMVAGIGLLALMGRGSAGAQPALPPTEALRVISTETAAKPEAVEGEALVRFHADPGMARAAAVLDDPGMAIVRHHPRAGVYQVRLAPGESVAAARARLGRRVAYIEPNYIVRAQVLPTDPRFSEQWAPHNTGAAGGTPDADIDLPEAWDLTTGSATVVVAVIDSGIDYTHPDLAPNMWVNPGEIAGNGIDDDRNGHVDDIHGIDCRNRDSDPRDDFGHGTHVAGTIGARGNDGIGIAGVNWNVRLMALKFLGDNGSGSVADAIECINYAAMMKVSKGINVRITSNSWGSTVFSQALHDAIAASTAADQLFVAAAGNLGRDIDRLPYYPGSFDLPQIISVGASDRGDGRAGFSNWGAVSVDLAAPAVDILSTAPGGSYVTRSGTSMASPHVAGVAALILARFPSATVPEVRRRLLAGAEEKGTWGGRSVTGGRLNAHRSLIPPPPAILLIPQSPPAGFSAATGEPALIRAEVMLGSAPGTGATVTASFANGDPSISLRDDGVAPDTATGDGVYAGFWTPAVAGPADITIAAASAGVTPVNRVISGRARTLPAYTKSPVAFQWEEISAAGTAFELGDDALVTLSSPMPIPFYGVNYTTFTVSSNGVISFDGGLPFYENKPLPSAETGAAELIAVLWDDLVMRPNTLGGRLYVALLGSAPARRLVVQWKDVSVYPATPNGGSTGLTFQVIIEESGRLLFQYQDVDCGLASCNGGGAASAGVQMNATTGIQHGFNQPLLSNGSAFQIAVPAPGSADLSLTLTDSPDPVAAFAPLTYRITVANAGPSAATNVQVIDPLPAGFSLVSAVPSQEGACTGDGTLACPLGTIAAGGSATVTLTGRPATAGTLINTARVIAAESDPVSDNNAATVTSTVTAAADLAVTLLDAPDPVPTGSTLTYTATVTNGSPVAVTNLQLTDVLPAGLLYRSATAAQGACTAPPLPPDGTVRCALGTLAAGASTTVSIAVTPAAAGTISNSVQVSAAESDSDLSNNSAGVSTTITTVPPGLPKWIELSATGGPPAPRGDGSNQAIGYDPASNRMLFFGGTRFDGVQHLNDTWVLAGADGTAGTPQWIQLATRNTPAPRDLHAGAYDVRGNILIVYGGCLGGCTPIDTQVYALDHANGLGGAPTWRVVPTGGGPPTMRVGTTATYDAANNRLMVFGGDNGFGTRLNSVWVLTNANGLSGPAQWTELKPEGPLPPGRVSHTAEYDYTNNRLIIFGGNTFPAPLNDVWVLANANGLGGPPAWSQLTATGAPPSARSGAVSLYDQATNRMMIFGGADGATTFNDMWVLTCANGLGCSPAWQRLDPLGVLPPGRSGALAVHSSLSNRLLLWSGSAPPDLLTDLWVLENANGITGGTSANLQVTATASPNPVTVGSRVTYTITVTNQGAAKATGVKVVDLLPDYMDLISSATDTITTTLGSCEPLDARTLSCSLGDLGPGASATIQISEQAWQVGTHTSSIYVSANETDLFAADNTVSLQSTTVSLQSTTIGDANNDKLVNAVDSLCIKRSLARLAATTTCPMPLPYPDVNLDRAVTSADALCLDGVIAGLPRSTSCPLDPVPLPAGPPPPPATGTAEVTIRVGGATSVAQGSEARVTVRAGVRVRPGAWTVDLAYDPAILAAVRCATTVGLCNATYSSGIVRFTGSATAGLANGTTLGEITFRGIGPAGSASSLGPRAITIAGAGGAPLRTAVEAGRLSVTAPRMAREPRALPAVAWRFGLGPLLPPAGTNTARFAAIVARRGPVMAVRVIAEHPARTTTRGSRPLPPWSPPPDGALLGTA